MFVKVPYKKLVVGKKYKIGGPCYDFTGIYKGIEDGQYVMLMFDKVTCENYQGSVSYSFLIYKDFYDFVPQAQWKMERRAVNLIVRRLIGDEHFEW